MEIIDPINPHRNIVQNAKGRLPVFPLGTDSLKAVRIPGSAVMHNKVNPLIKKRYSPRIIGSMLLAIT